MRNALEYDVEKNRWEGTLDPAARVRGQWRDPASGEWVPKRMRGAVMNAGEAAERLRVIVREQRAALRYPAYRLVEVAAGAAPAPKPVSGNPFRPASKSGLAYALLSDGKVHSAAEIAAVTKPSREEYVWVDYIRNLRAKGPAHDPPYEVEEVGQREYRMVFARGSK